MPAPVQYDVCVVGAGPVGGTLACRLAEAGLRVAVVDRAALPPMEHPDFDGRAYAIATGSLPFLEASGVWDALPAPSGPIAHIRVTDGRLGRPASRLFLDFQAAALGPDAGPFGWMVEARALRVALNARLHALPAIAVFAPAEAAIARESGGVSIAIAGGPSLTARLVVAAEGRNSPLRAAAGIPVTRLPYGQTGIVCAVAHERPHEQTALEHFLPAGPFAQLPMAPSAEAGPDLSAIVWTERTADAARILALDPARFAAELTRRLGDHLGAIRPVGRRWSYPLSAMFAHRLVATRLALVGDAAHGIHPIAGQGLNLGFRDAIALADLLIRAHAAGEDLGAPGLLARYQRARRADNLLMLLVTDGLDRLFSTNNPVLRLGRDLGLAAVDRIPPLKAAFMRQAMGLATSR